MTEPVFSRVAVLGLGLIGGSIAAGLKQRGLSEVVAWDADPASLETGKTNGVIDAGFENLDDAVRDADLIVLAVPVLAMADVLGRIELQNQVLTDVCSVKGHVIDAARTVFGEIPGGFVPGHPIAGSERHGVNAANPDLFESHRVILTPLPESRPDATEQLTRFWQSLGAHVVRMDPEHHDSVLAQTSHLPHLLAFGLVDTLSSGGDGLEVFEYAAGGFRDFSRIAASDPTMWRDVFLTNQAPVLEILDKYLTQLEQMKTMVAEGDGKGLHDLFTRAKVARDHFSALLDKR